MIKKYSYTRNSDGEKTNLTLVSTQNTKAIVVRDRNSELRSAQSIRASQQEVRLYVSMDLEVKDVEAIDDDDDNFTFRFEFDGKVWKLDSSSDIGKVSNLEGVVREIRLRPDLSNLANV